jgi:hypothetical protein
MQLQLGSARWRNASRDDAAVDAGRSSCAPPARQGVAEHLRPEDILLGLVGRRFGQTCV